MSTSAPTTCRSKCCASIWKSSATRDSAGRLISLRSGRPVTAVVPVHLYGQMADMDPILELADQYGLTVIEDACQAHGAEYFSGKHNRWMKAGSMGRAAAFSFYPGKNLGACGEGGAVTTNDAALAAKIEDAARPRPGEEVLPRCRGLQRTSGRDPGWNPASVKLAHLAKWNAQRRERAAEYNRLLPGNERSTIPYEPPGRARSITSM